MTKYILEASRSRHFQISMSQRSYVPFEQSGFLKSTVFKSEDIENMDFEESKSKCKSLQNNSSSSIKDLDSGKVTISIFGKQEIRYKVNKTRRLAGPMKMYSEKMGVPLVTFRFVFDGTRVQDHDTPESLGMKDGDVIEAYKSQLGGVNCNSCLYNAY